MVLPDEFPRADNINDNHFLLPTHLQEDILNEPPVFKKLFRLDYDCLPLKEKSLPLHTQDNTCNCTEICGQSCYNRVSRVECYNPTKLDCLCGLPIDKYIAKDDCGNRMLQLRQYASTERFQEFAMGWGLRATKPINQGDLVIEYIGEVIDDNTMRTRMQNQRKLTPNDHNFYIMQLDTGLYVDGKFKGNDSRFINHSCDPNCELQPWVVKGRMRIGIFAIKDIENGEALSYDYQFETNVRKTW